MLEADQLGNFHEAANGFLVEYFAVGCKHLAQLEPEDLRESFADLAIDSHLLRGRLAVEASRLKENGRAAKARDLVHLLAIERTDVSLPAFDVSACDKGSAWAEGFARPAHHVALFDIRQVVRIARVHVDRIGQAGLM